MVVGDNHLHPPLHRIAERLDVLRIGRIVDVIGNTSAIIDIGQLPLQTPLQGIVVVDALNHLRRQIGLLFREIDELLEISHLPRHLPQLAHIAVELVHHETCIPVVSI